MEIQTTSKGAPLKTSQTSSNNTEAFVNRHIGISENDQREMLQLLNLKSLDDLIDKTVPAEIRMKGVLDLPKAKSEAQALSHLKKVFNKNQIFRNFIGMGYYGTLVPAVIQRNVLENPSWYTQYTPYQAEISQGRLEALLNFQTIVTELTKMEIANASLLDEATAAAEAMGLAYSVKGEAEKNVFLVSADCHPQTIEVILTRAEPLGIKVEISSPETWTKQLDKTVFAGLVQYPTTDGRVENYEMLSAKLHENDALMCVAADLLSLTLLKPPGEWGADVVVGSTQRFGVPLGYGGPHAAYFATKDEYKRKMPGRLVGVSVDRDGRKAVRLALQTREQHIRRDKATSNICTAQVLLAIMASFYAVYHGPKGLLSIALRVHSLTHALAQASKKLGIKVLHSNYFDTLKLEFKNSPRTLLLTEKINVRYFSNTTIGVSIDESTTIEDIEALLRAFNHGRDVDLEVKDLADEQIPLDLRRQTKFLTQPIFNTHSSETEMLRYIKQLQNKDLSLAHSMIPLGSCTMKLNATSEMIPVSWSSVGDLHPFIPLEQAQGYVEMITNLEGWLSEITGFSATSLQPNAGSQGEYAGLLVIKKYHESRGEKNRNVCLIPTSAHGTNPASAVMAGMKVVPVRCDENGNVDVSDLQTKADANKASLAAIMITYPSTHGVFEEDIKKICKIVHDNGGQVYLDGANLNAMVSISRPGDFGADVCHVNLHKTFCIPHGGGGPGMGPIAVAKHLAVFLPGHKTMGMGTNQAIGAISSVPWGSPSILPIPYMYIAMMGPTGLKKATQIAILNANYIVKKLESHFPILYRGKNGLVAHECIIDCRKLTAETNVSVEDIAKRLMDYGFHAPTMSFPVVGTFMIEPTESESKAELDRFCEAIIAIKDEAYKNPEVVKMAPHTAEDVTRSEWNRSYTREQAAFPIAWVKQNKFWPAVARIDNARGDKNLFCTCDDFFSDTKKS